MSVNGITETSRGRYRGAVLGAAFVPIRIAVGACSRRGYGGASTRRCQVGARLERLLHRGFPCRSRSKARLVGRKFFGNFCAQADTVSARRAVLTGLEAADFRHPLDALATRQIEFIMRWTGMAAVVRRIIGPVAEQVLEIENIATGVLVGNEQMPSLYVLLTEACEILHIDVPDLYIRQNPVPNAYTLAINGQRPFIVLHSALLDMGLSAAELQTVIAHELGHLKCEHGIWITMANLLLLALGQLGELGRSLATVLGRRLFSWLQAAELSCDRAALLVMQDPRLVIGVLMKLSGGSATWAAEMNPDAFLQQAARLEAVSRTRLGRQVRQQMQRSATHPLPVVRARELDRWAHSVEYQRILARGYPRAAQD